MTTTVKHPDSETTPNADDILAGRACRHCSERIEQPTGKPTNCQACDASTECPQCGEPDPEGHADHYGACESCYIDEADRQHELNRHRNGGGMDDSDPRKPLYTAADVL